MANIDLLPYSLIALRSRIQSLKDFVPTSEAREFFRDLQHRCHLYRLRFEGDISIFKNVGHFAVLLVDAVGNAFRLHAVETTAQRLRRRCDADDVPKRDGLFNVLLLEKLDSTDVRGMVDQQSTCDISLVGLSEFVHHQCGGELGNVKSCLHLSNMMVSALQDTPLVTFAEKDAMDVVRKANEVPVPTIRQRIKDTLILASGTIGAAFLFKSSVQTISDIEETVFNTALDPSTIPSAPPKWRAVLHGVTAMAHSAKGVLAFARGMAPATVMGHMKSINDMLDQGSADALQQAKAFADSHCDYLSWLWGEPPVTESDVSGALCSMKSQIQAAEKEYITSVVRSQVIFSAVATAGQLLSVASLHRTLTTNMESYVVDRKQLDVVCQLAEDLCLQIEAGIRVADDVLGSVNAETNIMRRFQLTPELDTAQKRLQNLEVTTVELCGKVALVRLRFNNHEQTVGDLQRQFIMQAAASGVLTIVQGMETFKNWTSSSIKTLNMLDAANVALLAVNGAMTIWGIVDAIKAQEFVGAIAQDIQRIAVYEAALVQHRGMIKAAADSLSALKQSIHNEVSRKMGS